MKTLLTLALMLCVCTGIHAQKEVVGATVVVAPCSGVSNIVFFGEATKEQIAEAQAELKRRCAEKAAQEEKNKKGSTELH